MAITAPQKLSDFSGFISREEAAPIFQKAAEQSVVQRLSPQVPLGGNGVSIPVVSTQPVASWVAEGTQKPVTQGGMTLKTMDPNKLVVLHVASDEVVRANPGGFIQAMENEIAGAFALAFDNAALHGTNTPFAASIADTTKSVEFGGNTVANGGVYKDIVDGLEELVDADKELTGFAMSTKAEPRLLGAVDTAGHPIFVDLPSTETSPNVRNARLLGRPGVVSKNVHQGDATVEIIGGDWTQAAWGVVGGVQFNVSTETAVTINGSLVSAFEHNLVVFRFEVEYGFVINDPAAFVLYLNNIGS